MNEQIKILSEKLRSSMLDFEKINEVINGIPDKNIINIKLKQRLKEYSNQCLSDLLIFSDVVYQLLESSDNEEMHMLLEILDGADDD
jgi:hypothetical protein